MTTEEKTKLVACKILEAWKTHASLKRLEQALPELDSGEIATALDRIAKDGFANAMGQLGLHYDVNLELLKEYVETKSWPWTPGPCGQPPAPPAAPAATAAPATAEAPTPAEPAPEPAPAEPGEKPARLKNELPKKQHKSKLDSLLEKIEATEVPTFYEGEAREAKINETVERMIDVVVRVNAGITKLAERVGLGIVDPDADLVSLVRTKEGQGGIKATYSNDGGRSEKVLYFEAWSKYIDDAWCERAIKRLERQAADMLGRMTEYCIRQRSGGKKRK